MELYTAYECQSSRFLGDTMLAPLASSPNPSVQLTETPEDKGAHLAVEEGKQVWNMPILVTFALMMVRAKLHWDRHDLRSTPRCSARLCCPSQKSGGWPEMEQLQARRWGPGRAGCCPHVRLGRAYGRQKSGVVLKPNECAKRSMLCESFQLGHIYCGSPSQFLEACPAYFAEMCWINLVPEIVCPLRHQAPRTT